MPTLFCGGCGAPRRNPEQRFCSSCGAAFDAGHEHAPPAPTAPPPSAAPAYGFAEQPPPGGVPDYAVPVPPGPRRKSRAGMVVGIGALVLALTAGGVVAWQVFGPEGGADSPEAAAETFLTSLADQDGVGLLSVVAPGEVEGLDDVYGSARDRLEEEGLIEGGEISGAVDLEFTDLEFEVDELGDGIARVTLDRGTMTATYDPAELPDKLDFVAEDNPEKESETVDLAAELDEDSDEGGIETGLTTIQVDGRWYVSVLGSYADLLYQSANAYGDLDAPRPDYDAVADEVDPIVGETPEEVVDNLVQAVEDGDVDGLLANLPEGLGISLRPYARTVESLLEQEGVSATVTESDVDVETEDLGDGKLKVVVREADFGAEAYAADDYAAGSVSVDGTCLEAADEEGYGDGFCVPDRLLDDLGIDDLYLVMTEVDGGYQLDPVGTVTSYATTALERLPDELVDEALEAIETGDDSYFECYVEDC